MRQAIAVTGHGIVEPPLESNQPCLHTRAALQIALRRHKARDCGLAPHMMLDGNISHRSSPRTVLSSSGDTVRRLRISVGLSGSADGTMLHHEILQSQCNDTAMFFSKAQLFHCFAPHNIDHAERVIHIMGDLFPRLDVEVVAFHDVIFPEILQLLQSFVNLFIQGITFG